MRLPLALSVLASLSVSAVAQDTDRYSMQKTPEGYVRMDTRTGQMSLCKETGAQLVCQLAADDRDALQDEIGMLRDKLDGIEKRVVALEATGRSSGVPTESEFEQTMSYMERFFRGFVGIVKELDRDIRGPEEPEQPVPNRT